jgi:hypothetical protein
MLGRWGFSCAEAWKLGRNRTTRHQAQAVRVPADLWNVSRADADFRGSEHFTPGDRKFWVDNMFVPAM